MESKVCRRCSERLPLSSFYKRKAAKDGYRNICRKCSYKRSVKGGYSTRKVPDGYSASYSHRVRTEDPVTYRARNLYNSAKHRSKKLGVPFDLDRKWVKQRLVRGVCEVTGLPFDFPLPCFGGRSGPRNNWIPSLDREDPGGGYTKDNVRVVVWCYNGAKASGTDDDVLRMARALLSKA